MSEKKLDGLPHGIKELVSYEPQSHTWILWWVLAIVLLLLILFLFWRYLQARKRKAAVLATPIERLRMLKVSDDFDSSDAVEQRNLYEALSRLFKEHLLLLTKIDLEGKTLKELKPKLSTKEIPLTSETLKEFKSILERGDLIKFAGQTVNRETAVQDLQAVVRIATDLEKAVGAEHNDFR